MSYAFGANIITTILSTIFVMFLPKLVDIREYGAIQLMLFYINYIGFLHFGLPEGIYLRYGGIRYEDIKFKVLVWEYVIAVTMIACFSIITFFYLQELVFDPVKRYVGIGTCVIAIGQHLIWFNTYVLQMSNRIKDYSKVVVFDKFIFVFGIILSVFCIDYNYKTLIMALVITRYISALYSIFLCKEIFFQLPNHCFFRQAIFDYKNNLECGFKLLISSFLGLLILGIIRWAISVYWSIEVFAVVSFSLSMVMFFLSFINSVGIALFPFLKKLTDYDAALLYKCLNYVLYKGLFSLLFFYYPIVLIVNIWLPKYGASLEYLGILIPILIFETKYNLLLSNYTKALRLEKKLLKVTFYSIILCLMGTGIFVFFCDLKMGIVLLVLVLYFKYKLCEVKMAKIYDLPVIKNSFIELLFLIFFEIIINLKIEISALLNISIYLIFFLYKKQEFFNAWRQIQKILR